MRRRHELRQAPTWLAGRLLEILGIILGSHEARALEERAEQRGSRVGQVLAGGWWPWWLALWRLCPEQTCVVRSEKGGPDSTPDSNPSRIGHPSGRNSTTRAQFPCDHEIQVAAHAAFWVMSNGPGAPRPQTRRGPKRGEGPMEGNGCSLHNSVPRFRASGWGRGGKRARVLNPKVRVRTTLMPSWKYQDRSSWCPEPTCSGLLG